MLPERTCNEYSSTRRVCECLTNLAISPLLPCFSDSLATVCCGDDVSSRGTVLPPLDG